METSVLIQVPYELESVYSPLEERTDIDYTVMSVDNFNVGDFLIGLYITISSNSVITGVVSGMIWAVQKFFHLFFLLMIVAIYPKHHVK